MNMNVYSIFDLKAKCYSSPFFQHNDGVALRSFIDLVNDKRSAVYAHAEDYVLHQLGTFDDSTGKLESINPKILCTAISVQDPKEDPRQTQMFKRDPALDRLVDKNNEDSGVQTHIANIVEKVPS